MKKLLMITILFCSLFTTVYGAESETAKGNLNSVDLSGIERSFSSDTSKNMNQVIPYFNFSDIAKDVAAGKISFDIPDLLNRGLRLLFKEIFGCIHIMVKLIVLVILCSVLSGLEMGENKENISNMAFFACYAILAGIGVQCFVESVNVGKELLSNSNAFIATFLPVIAIFLAASGSAVSAAIFQPVLLLVLDIMGSVIINVIIPIIFCIIALSIINNLTEKFAITSLIGLLKSFVKYTLGIMLTLFAGIIAVQQFASATIDGVTLKTAKFAVGSLVPMVGGILSDSVEMVITSSLILKNAVGIAGLIAIIVMAVLPIIKLSASVIIFRLTGALIEPIAEKRFVTAINDLATGMSMIIACVVSVMIFMLIMVAIALISGNNAANLR